MHPAHKIFAAVTVLLLAGCNPQPKRGAGEPCLTNSHCLYGSCHRGMCSAKDPVGTSQPCLNHGDCKSYLCTVGLCLPGTGATGSACLNHEECGSVTCSSGACAPGVGKAGGRTCDVSAECAGKVCHHGVCLSLGPGDVGGCCKGGWACKSFRCQSGVCVQGDGATGSACFYHEQCVTAYCKAGSCAANPCPVKPDGGGADKAVKVDGPKIDGPKIDGPKIDGPKIDGPKIDGPKIDGPQVDALKVVDQAITPDLAKPVDSALVVDSAPGPVVKWGSAVSAGSSQSDNSTAISTDATGNSYITGTFMDTATFGTNKVTALNTSYSDLYVARLNANKKWGWAAAGGAQYSSDWGMALATAPQGYVHVTGRFGGTAKFGTITPGHNGMMDALVARLSPTGAFVWATNIGGAGNDLGTAIAVDSSDRSYVCGHFSGKAWFGDAGIQRTSKGGTDIFVAKLNPYSLVLWAKTIGGAGNDFCRGLALGASGDVTVAGSIGGAVTVGLTSLKFAGGNDIIVARYGSAGGFKWATTAGGAGFDEAFGVGVDSSGNATATGTFSGAATFGTIKRTSTGTDDVHLMRVDNTGKITWVLTPPSAGKDDWGRAIACASTGECYATGYFSNKATLGANTIKSKGATDVFITKVTAAGAFAWATSAGGSLWDDMGTGIALTPTGAIHVTGLFKGTATFGSQVLTSSAGSNDGFVVVLPKQ
jgi:hypothetical protein